jgi:putative ABC transport system permease protein
VQHGQAVAQPAEAAAAALGPVARGCRISVGEALRDYGIPPPRGGARGGWLLRHTSGLRRPVLLSLRNAFRNRQRMALTLITLATGGAVYLGAQNLRASILGSVDLLFSSQRYDLGLRMARPYPARALEAAVASVAGVARVEAWSSALATVSAVSRPDGTPGSTFPITAPPLSSRLLVFAMERGRWPRAGDRNALVVNRRLLEDEPDLEVGAEVTLLVEGRPARFKVVGVVDSGPAAGAYASRDALSAIDGGGGGGANMAVVAASLAGPASRLDLVRRLRAELAAKGFEVLSTALTAQQREVVEAHLLMVGGFLGVMGQLMIVVGGLGLGSTMSIAVLERRREIGVLRAIGARHRAILTLVQVEGLVIAAASGILALPLSVPMSIVLGQAFGRIMLRLPLTLVPQPGGVLRWLAVLVVVSLAACSWPAWRAMRVTTAAALAY